jgi:HSP20 family protein
MANMTRVDPLNLARFEPLLDVNDFFKGLGVRPFTRAFQPEPQMKMDVTEANGSYLVMAEIPGVNKNDIHVSIDGNLVSISAEVKGKKRKVKVSYAVNGILAGWSAVLRWPMRWIRIRFRPNIPMACLN